MSPGIQVFIPPQTSGRSLPRPLGRGINSKIGKSSGMIVLRIDIIASIIFDSGVHSFHILIVDCPNILWVMALCSTAIADRSPRVRLLSPIFSRSAADLGEKHPRQLMAIPENQGGLPVMSIACAVISGCFL